MRKCLLFLISITCISCSPKQDGFFGSMPDDYDVDSLETFQELIGNLKTTKTNGGDVLQVEADDCDLLPICGYLTYKNDSLFHSRGKDGVLNFLVRLNGKRFEKHVMEYASDTKDVVTFLGKIATDLPADSVFLVMLEPSQRKGPTDAAYLRFITLKRGGGITNMTFAHMFGQVSIELSQQARVTHRTN